jgi:Uma2 family endonuclease
MADLTIPRRVTYEDYRRFPDDGKIYEILEGEIHMTPAPSPRHQYASKRLHRLLESYFEGPRGFEVFDSPIDVILADDDVVQPDLLVAARPQISRRGIEGPPLIVVEILSPARLEYDRITKARRYAVRDVANYWIVDADRRTVECFRLREGVYQLEASAQGDDALPVSSFPGLTITLATLWLDTERDAT